MAERSAAAASRECEIFDDAIVRGEVQDPHQTAHYADGASLPAAPTSHHHKRRAGGGAPAKKARPRLSYC